MEQTKEEVWIIKALERCGGEGVPAKALMREASIRNKTVFYDTLNRMEEIGEVKIDKDHWVQLLSTQGDVKAVLVSLSEHFGFARPLDGGEDLFVPGTALKGAFLGDEVLLTDVRREEKGPSGRIKRILAQNREAVTGTVRVEKGQARVTPDNAIRFDLAVQSADLHGAKDGDKVLVQPLQDQRGDWRSARVVFVFGRGDSARVCADAIVERCGIPHTFPPEVLLEAEVLADLPVTQEDINRRLDLREEPVFTIDSADAKDLDDAISVLRTEDGWSLGVHIADVSHYVKAGSAIDREAFARGTSVYFADRVIPMLPEALSNGVCSLNAGVPKLTFSALMDFDREGNMVDFAFRKTVIQSKVRGVYSEVNQLLDGTAGQDLRDKYAPVAESLAAAKALADLLAKRGRERGEMDLSSDEIKFVLDERGVCVNLLPRVSGGAEQLIEQLMIAANIAAAKAALQAKIPFLFRVHEKPRAERVQELSELLIRLGVRCKELKKGNPSAKDFAAVLDRVKGTELESLVNQRILRTMEKARYADEELGHFGLALAEYSHFTSPIRRYPDTAIHRILSGLEGDQPIQSLRREYEAFAGEAALESSRHEIRAVTAERAAEDCYVAEYLQAHLGERHVGVISGATARGLFVKLDNNAEGFVSLNDFTDAQFQFDGEVAHRDLRSGKVLMVGQRLAILVASVDIAAGRVDFVPAEPQL